MPACTGRARMHLFANKTSVEVGLKHHEEEEQAIGDREGRTVNNTLLSRLGRFWKEVANAVKAKKMSERVEGGFGR